MNNSRSLIPVAIAATLATIYSTVMSPPADKPITVFLVRHAATVPETKAAPDRFLSATGKARAQDLRRLLGKAGVSHIFSTDYPRTRGTVGPLAKAIGLKIEFISSRRAKEQVQALHSLPPGSVAVVAGHSNTLPKLIKSLGGSVSDLTRRGFLAEHSHDRLFMMTLGKGTAVQTVELRYGEQESAEKPAAPRPAAGDAAKVDPAALSIGAAKNERKSSAIFFFSRPAGGFKVHGQYELTHGSPGWKASHGEAVEEAAAGTRFRLGNNFFTTFDTSCSVEVGGVVLGPGLYYLALERGAGEEMSLVFLDPTAIRAAKLNSSQTSETKGGAKAAMRWTKTAASVEQLQIALSPTAKKGDKVDLTVRFGRHQLVTTLRAVF